jgi:hypothetical protein
MAAVLTAAAGQPAMAQSGAFALYAQGGHHMPLADLSDAGDALGSGVSYGGGLALMLGQNLAIRGYVNRHSSNYSGDALMLQDRGFARLFYGGDLLIGWTTGIGLAPYILGGVGGVRIDPEESGEASFAKFATRFGTGINFLIQDARLTPFLEISGWIFDFDRLGFDRTQVDFTMSVGLAWTIPY